MMAATAAAVFAAFAVGSPPIYESLRERMPDRTAQTDASDEKLE
jgi:CIC family chloride channel protein